MGTSLAGVIERLISLLKLQSTIPALLWLVINWLIFEPSLQAYRLFKWWLGLEAGTQVSLLLIVSIFVGYALDNFNFIVLSLCMSEDVKFVWTKDEPVLSLGATMVDGINRISLRHRIEQAEKIWPHISAILSENGYSAQVDREKVSLDFFLNLTILSLTMTTECVFAHMFGWRSSFIVPWLSLLAAVIFYRLTIPSATKWYDWVNAAFDLYRYELAEQLMMRPFTNRATERADWEGITELLTGISYDYANFDYPLPSTRNPEPTGPDNIPYPIPFTKRGKRRNHIYHQPSTDNQETDCG